MQIYYYFDVRIYAYSHILIYQHGNIQVCWYINILLYQHIDIVKKLLNIRILSYSIQTFVEKFMTNKNNKAALKTQEPPVTDFASLTSTEHVLDQNKQFKQ